MNGNANQFRNERLFDPLKVTGGRRQFVISGEQVSGRFMIGWQWGLSNLENALKRYLPASGYEIVVFFRPAEKPIFLTAEMEKKFNEIARKTSDDPQAQGRATNTFVPRGQRTPPPTDDAVSSSPNVSAPAPVAQRAAQTSVEVTAKGASAEQQFLDQITRLLASPVKSAVVVFHPENMWLTQPTENDLRKLETILRWSKIDGGHAESASLLVVSHNRLGEFNTLADHRLDRKNFTRNLNLPFAGKAEIERFLWRLVCRYNLTGQLDKIAATAYAKQASLYNFANGIVEYLEKNPQTHSLDGIFSDDEQVKTLDELLAEINGLIGLKAVKEKVKQLVATADYEKQQRRRGYNPSASTTHLFFLGNPGTGKTMVARLLGQIFWALGLRQSRAFVEIAYSDVSSSFNPGEVVENLKNKTREAMGGVLFIDEFYLFGEDEWGRKAFQALMKDMEDHRDNLTVILAGYAGKLQDFYKVNPGIETRVPHKLFFEDYGADELRQMFAAMARKEGNLILTAAAQEKLHRYLDSFAKRGGIGNGRGLRTLFEKTLTNRASRRADDREIIPDDLPDPISFRQAEAEKILAALDNEFIGLPKVKTFFREMYRRQQGLELQGKTINGYNNCVFLGNPGTGKTSVAREMGKLFYALGIISEKDKLEEVDPISAFTSQYQAEYAQKVRDVFDRALGGVLFIDEAYQLAKDQQGRQALDQIVKLLAEPRYANLVVVMAGYADEMQELYKCNSGLKRRFPHEIYFDNFKTEELRQIFYQCAEQDKLSVTSADKSLFDAKLFSLLAKMAQARNFGNAGAVGNFYRDVVKTNQMTRLLNDASADKSRLLPADLTGQTAPAESIDDILAEMDKKFVGLAPVKKQIRALANKIRVGRQRAEALKKVSDRIAPGQYNMRFVGSPGTGKTTIARYMARVFCALGIIDQTLVTEYRGVDLKGSYVGQTKDKVNDLFEKNAGRVVVIDEIYSLYDTRSGQPDSFGTEAIDTLVGGITDERNLTTIFVIAGYENRMDEFLSANPGLASRFPSEIKFPDYTDAECSQILGTLLANDDYVCADAENFTTRADEIFARRRQQAGANFGNARAVGGVFSHIMENMDNRLVAIIEPTADDFRTVLPSDFDGV